MDRAAIIGVGMTKIEKRKIGATFADMAWEAVNKALADAGMTIDDIDNVVTTSSDFWDGRTISSMAICDASNAFGKDITTVEGDGTFGALYGMMRILSGSFGVTIVCAHHKGTESSMNGIITKNAATIMVCCCVRTSEETKSPRHRVEGRKSPAKNEGLRSRMRPEPLCTCVTLLHKVTGNPEGEYPKVQSITRT